MRRKYGFTKGPSRKSRVRRAPCSGSTAVLALLVSLMLMVLVTATMAMTVVNVQVVNDYGRNAKTLQAADSGVVHGGAVLSHALSAWLIPPATTSAKVDAYTADALSGATEGDRDISLVKDTATHVGEVMPRSQNTTVGYTDPGGAGRPQVRYGAAVNIVPTGVDLPPAGDITDRHIFHYDYSITSGGQSQIGGKQNRATRVERGKFDVQVQRPSFSTYGYFTQTMKNQFNQQLVFFDGETYSGPTHVNTAPPDGRAGFYGRPVFNGPFTAVQARYEDSWLGGNANPAFNGGATWGVAQIELPANGWSQARAALGDYANIENQNAMTPDQLAAQLGINLVNGQVPKDCYYDNEQTGRLLGGIYVNGDASKIQFSISGGDQVTTIDYKDNSGLSHECIIHENHASNTCSVWKDGTLEGNWNGVMNGVIHVEGKVNSLTGDSSATSPDIQSQEQVTVSATNNIIITNHITYQTDPTSNPDAKNILGIFSSNGNIYLGRNAPNDLKLNATVMAASANHGIGAEGLATGSGYDSSYPNKGLWNLLGGLIENKNQTTGVYYSNGVMTGYKWNFTYDTRFAAGVSPPFFPYVTKYTIAMENKRAEGWGRKYY